MRNERRLSRRRFLAGDAVSRGRAAPLRLRPALAGARVPQSPLHRRGHDDAGAASFLSPSSMAKEFPSPTSRRLQGQRLDRPGRPGHIRRIAANGFADWKLKVGGLVETAGRVLARRSPRHAVAHPDHPPRLRRRLELHRQVDRRPARARARQGAGSSRRRATSCSPAPTQLEKTLDGSGRYYETHRPRGRLPPADDPRLRHERRSPARPPWRAAPPPGRAPARLQDGEIRDAIDAIDSFASLGRGQGSFWADRGYDWYAGI